MDKKVEIVSLGVNCLPRTFLTRNGIKPSKAQGELSCPFDLVKHPFDSIIYNLDNNFENYTDDLFFVLRKRFIFDFRQKGLWQKPDGTIFFHDKDCKAKDLDKLKTRITKRIENFRSITKSERPVLFVICIYENTDKIEELYTVLKTIRQDRKFTLAILNFSDKIIQTPNAYVLNLIPPYKNYSAKWNITRFVKSKLGQYIEHNISSFIQRIIEQEF